MVKGRAFLSVAAVLAALSGATAPGGDERALATGPSVGAWLNRIFMRSGR
jgi:hypothetical protein